MYYCSAAQVPARGQEAAARSVVGTNSRLRPRNATQSQRAMLVHTADRDANVFARRGHAFDQASVLRMKGGPFNAYKGNIVLIL